MNLTIKGLHAETCIENMGVILHGNGFLIQRFGRYKGRGGGRGGRGGGGRGGGGGGGEGGRRRRR